ncbi:DNA helicase [Malassezia sp. CBS 17886]|nr:DNA helicase [Malassezia sp. CBS 17886]
MQASAVVAAPLQRITQPHPMGACGAARARVRGGGRQRRTLLECMPRRTVFRMLSFLAYEDIVALLCADRRLRPFVYAAHFIPWRKRHVRLHACEMALERQLRRARDDADDGERPALCAAECALRAAYDECLGALQLRAPPTRLHELVPALVACGGGSLPPAAETQAFVVPLLLGRVRAGAAFRLFDHGAAVELLSLVRAFIAVARIARLCLASTNGSQYPHMFHVLEADCTRTLDAFFAPPPLRMHAPQAAADSYTLTAEQAAFVAHDVRATELVRVQAYAGTGKTRSLMAYAHRRPQQRFLYITFNAATAAAARTQFPPNVDCRTMHSLALRHVVLRDAQQLGSLRPRDVVTLLRGQLPAGRSLRAPPGRRAAHDRLAPTTVATYVLRTVDRFMQSGDAAFLSAAHVPRTMAQHTDLTPAAVTEAARTLWELIRAGTTRAARAVPCPHDAYVKMLQLCRPADTPPLFREYDVVLLDEAQDLSACQTDLLLRARATCGVIVVGDVHQKIYGFRGGTATAFHERRYRADATFALTQSFRFGARVAALAGGVLALKAPPPWNAHARAPPVRGRGTDAVYRAGRAFAYTGHAPRAAPLQHTRVYRTNMLLAQDALRLAIVLPLAATLFLKTSQSLQYGPLLDLFRDAHTLFHGRNQPLSAGSPLREFAAWKELEEHVDADEGGAESKLALAVSLAPTLAAPDFLEQVQRLEHRFCAVEREATVVLTTVHQAKGLEWDRVVLADDFSPVYEKSTPSLRPEVTGLAAQDELNHVYVALTRAREELVIPDGLLKWVAALQGLFSYRLSEKDARTACPFCRAKGRCLAQLSVPLAHCAADRAHDGALVTLGCLACMRQRLEHDEDFEDFVRDIDACGVSTTTGRLTPAAIARNVRRFSGPLRKRKRAGRALAGGLAAGGKGAGDDEDGHAATQSAEDALARAGDVGAHHETSLPLATFFPVMLQLRKQSVVQWLTVLEFWTTQCKAGGGGRDAPGSAPGNAGPGA